MAQIGTNGNDPESYFNNEDPVIYGLDGDDFIRITAGIEGVYIEGGRGNDIVYSGEQAATVYGGDGDDIIYGGYNPSFRDSRPGDHFYGGAGNDVIHSGGGNDRIFGDEGNDTIYGTDSSGWFNAGNSSTIDGGPGDDIIFAGAGIGTRVSGGDGDDIIYGMNARALFGGNGSDTYEVTSTLTIVFETEEPFFDSLGHDNVFAYVDFTLPDHVENLIMTYGVQTYGYGNDENNLIYGNESGNVLEGKGGYDTLTGGAGSDLFIVNPSWGVDVIADFSAGAGTQDAVLFSRSIFSDYQQVVAHARQVGTDTWIEDGTGNTVVLPNITLASLHSNDFGFI